MRQKTHIVNSCILIIILLLTGCKKWTGCENFSAESAEWLIGENSPNFSHLEWPKSSTTFSFDGNNLAALISLNYFDLSQGQDEVLFGLRGCQIINGNESGFEKSVDLTEDIPNHASYRDVIGVWKQSTGEIAVFQGSTVPNWEYMCMQVEVGGHNANMLPTGRYLYTVGSHRDIEGAFRQDSEIVVLRSNDNLIYETSDDWEVWSPHDNLHPGGCPDTMFSSAGCQTIPGTYGIACPGYYTAEPDQHLGPWNSFRTLAGLNPNDNKDKWGDTYVYILLTCREAELVGSLSNISELTRLRFGSSGNYVVALQTALNNLGYKSVPIDGFMGPETTIAFIEWEQSQNDSLADGIVTPSEAKMLGISLDD